MLTRYYCIVYKSEIFVFNNWKDTDSFLKRNKGFKLHKSFESKEKALFWGNSKRKDIKEEDSNKIIKDTKTIISEPIDQSENKTEIKRILKLIVKEFREPSPSFKNIAICLDKLSKIF